MDQIVVSNSAAKAVRRVALGAAMLLSGVAFADAPVPVAVWDCDFSDTARTQYTGYSLEDWNETHGANKTSVTIDRANQGLLCDLSSAYGYFTVLVKYSGLSPSATNKRVLFATTANSTYNYNRCGIRLQTNGKLIGSWNNSTTGNNDADYGTASTQTMPECGTVAFVYDRGASGLSVYAAGVDESFPSAAIWNNAALKAGNIYGFSIGGQCREANVTGVEAATGMKITAIAVFNQVLTVGEMNEYSFSGEISANVEGLAVSVSQLNATYAGRKVLNLTFEDGAVLNLDEELSALALNISSPGDLTITADSEPSADELAKIDVSGVEGNIIRTWVATGGIGFNFNSNVGEDTSCALVDGSIWFNDGSSSASGSKSDLFPDGITAVSWTSANYYNDGDGSSIMRGYLDDGGNGPTITMTNVPYESYDVIIYCSTDSSNYRFKAKTVNGKTYLPDPVSGGSVETEHAAATWGTSALKTTGKAVYGVNAMRVNGLSGNLTISGGTNSRGINGNYARGCISAIQIVPAGTPDKSTGPDVLNIAGGTVKWSEGAWQNAVGDSYAGVPSSGHIVVKVTANSTLSLDTTVSLDSITFEIDEDVTLTVNNSSGSATFSSPLVTIKGGTLKQGSAQVFGSSPQIAVGAGGTFDLSGNAVNDATYVMISGSGSGDSPYALSSTGSGARIKNVSLFGDAVFHSDYDVTFGLSGSGNYLYLNGFALVKKGAGELDFINENMPGMGTVDVSEGAIKTVQWNSFNNSGGATKLIIRAAAEFIQTADRTIYVDSLEWEEGGTLTTTSYGLGVNNRFLGCGQTDRLAFSGGAAIVLTGDLNVDTVFEFGSTLSIEKDEDARTDNDGYVTVFLPSTVTGTGAVTVGAYVHLNLGTGRPGGSFEFDETSRISITQRSDADIPQIKTAFVPSKDNVRLYDAYGAEIYDYEISLNETSGVLSFFPISIPVWKGTVSAAFDSQSNWANSKMPAVGQPVVIDANREVEVAITVTGTYNISDLYILGGSTVSFKGNGSIILPPASSAGSHVVVNAGAVLVRTPETVIDTDSISVSSGGVLVIDAGDGTFTESAVISGAGSVETYGTVTMGASNTFTGGLTVGSGTTSTTSSTGYGPNRYGQAIANLARIVVMDGGCLDLKGTKDTCYAITISGKGVLGEDGVYSGAIINSGSEMGSNSRQTSSLTLAADAMVKAKEATNGWGLVNSGHAATVLALNGHTLTISGKGNFPIVNANTANGTTTTGTLIVDGVTLGLVSVASNFTGVNVIVKGSDSLNVGVAPTAIGSLTIKPSKTGTTATAWNLPSGFVPAVDTSNIDPDTVEVGEVLDIFTAPSELSSDTISVEAGGRYTSTITGTKVQITVKELANFFHYNFNGADGGLNGGKAEDSTYQINSIGGSVDSNLLYSRNGRSMYFHFISGDTYTPYWGAYSSGNSPIHAGEMTVVAVIKPKEASNSILWGFGNSAAKGVAVIAKDEETISLIGWTGGSAASEIVSVSGIGNLIGRYHFIVIISSADGTELRVDGLSEKSTALLPSFDGRGQLGSIHGGSKGYSRITSLGYVFDDWTVYDARLTDDELVALKKRLLPDPFVIYIR